LRGLDLNQRPSGYEAKKGPFSLASQRWGTIHRPMKRRGIRRHRSIMGRHTTSRDLRSSRQPRVNEKITGKNPEGFARRVAPEGCLGCPFRA
jgi:hypothetical protein